MPLMTHNEILSARMKAIARIPDLTDDERRELLGANRAQRRAWLRANR